MLLKTSKSVISNRRPNYNKRKVIAMSKESSGLEESKGIAKEKEKRADERKKKTSRPLPRNFSNGSSFRKKQVHWNASPWLHRALLTPTLTAALPFV
jgi:hypothetical protein